MSHQPTPLINTKVAIIMGTAVPQILAFVYQPLADIFIKRGYEVDIYAIPGHGLKPMNEATSQLDEMIFKHNKNHFILVGHSQGGVHAIGLASKHPKRTEAVFNFGTPHHGTVIASLGNWFDWMPSIREMKAHSKYLHELREVNYSHERIHSLFTVFDELIVPWFASTVHGSQNIILMPKSLQKLLKGIGLRADEEAELIHGYADHLFIIWHKKFHEYIDRTLNNIENNSHALSSIAS